MWAKAHSPSLSTEERRCRVRKPLRSSECRSGGRLGLVSAQRARPEDLADDGGVLEGRLLLGREPVEAGGDDPLQRLGKRQVVRRAALEVELRELLGVERVALRALEQRLLDLRREQRALEHVRDEERGLLVRERREADRRGVELAAAPAGSSLEELRPGAADDEERDVAQPVDELVDEVEQAVVGPVQILEHEDERALLGERLEEAPPGGEGLAAAVATEPGLGLEPDERTEVRLDPAGIGGVLDRVLDRARGASRLPLPRCRARGCRPAP